MTKPQTLLFPRRLPSFHPHFFFFSSSNYSKTKNGPPLSLYKFSTEERSQADGFRSRLAGVKTVRAAAATTPETRGDDEAPAGGQRRRSFLP